MEILLENTTRMEGEEERMSTVGGVLMDFVGTAQELPHLSV
jgi:hypothetical protein